MKNRIGVLVHRSLPAPRLRPAVRYLDRMGVAHELVVASATLDPAGAARWVSRFEQSGGEVIVTFDDAGGSLAALASAHTRLPVICCPIRAASAGTAGMPPPPLAVVGSENPVDALVFAVKVLALADQHLRRRLDQDHAEEIQRLEEHGKRLKTDLQETKGHPDQGQESTSRPAIPSPPSGADIFSARDEELVEHFARNFRPQLKTERENAVPALPPALDYSMVLRELITEARDMAVHRQPDGRIHPVHFLAALARLPQAAALKALRESGADATRLRTLLDEILGPEVREQRGGIFSLAPESEQVLARAREIARGAGRTCLTTVDILLALGEEEEDPRFAQVLQAAGIDPDLLHEILLRPETAGAECDELDAAREHRLPKAASPLALDSGTLQQMRQRLQRAPGEPSEVIDIPGTSGSAELEDGSSAVPSPPAGEPAERPPAKARLMGVDGQNPDLDEVEQISDTLLEGGLVVLPTDITFALLADATNPAAVEKLYAVARRPRERPITALVHSTTLLKSLVRDVTPEVEEMLDELWPGPLTVIFPRHPTRFQALGGESTLGVRLPDHYLTLSVLSMLGRPVAAVAVPGAEEKDLSARSLHERLEEEVSLVVDARETPRRLHPTVLAVAGGDYRILRRGATPREEIEKALGRAVKES